MNPLPTDKLIKLVRNKDWEGLKKEIAAWLDGDLSEKEQAEVVLESALRSMREENEDNEKRMRSADLLARFIKNIKTGQQRLADDHKLSAVKDKIANI